MEADGMKYVAVRDIQFNGVNAYREGQLVHESVVEGPDAWLKLGDDVKPREGARLARPANNASQAAWSAYVVSQGKADADTAEGLPRAELIKRFGG